MIPERREVTVAKRFNKDLLFYKFCLYGFLKNLNFFEPFLILFFLEKGFSFLEIGTLYSIQFVASNILQIPTGVFADSAGRRRTMLIAFAAYIISFIIFFLASSYVPVAVAMIFFAFGESFRSGTHKAMIFQYLRMKGWEDQKVHYYGHTRSWSQAGSAISALIAGGIVFFSGTYRYVFLASVLPYVLDMLLVMSYPRELDGSVREFRWRDFIANIRAVLKDFLVTFRNPAVLRSVSNTAVYSGYYDALKHYLQPVLKTFALALPVLLYLDDKKRSAIVVGVVYFLLYVQAAFFARISGRIAERFRHLAGPLNLTLLAGILFGMVSGLFYARELTLPAILLYIGVYAIHNLRKPMSEAFIADMVDHDILATALSAEEQIATLLKALIAPALGFIADWWGVGYALAAVSAVIIVTVPLYAVREERSEPVR